MKVFPDTNVWVAAVVFPGLCDALITECADRGWLLTSRLVRREAHAVLSRKFPGVEAAPALFDAAWTESRCVADMREPADDADRRLVHAAERAGAELFVTGDKRVLSWKHAGSLRIVTLREAWGLLFNP